MKQRTRGFTLFEIIAVMLVVSIIAAFATSRFPTTATFGVTTVVDQLKRDIRYTQILAMSLGTDYTITVVAGGYSIVPTPPDGAVSVTAPTGVTLTPASITFNSMGDPSLVSSVSITVSGSGNSQILTINPETGYVDG